MELTRLYPGWCTAGLYAPQPYVLSSSPWKLLCALKKGILHNGYLFDLFGTDFPANSARTQVTWVLWSYNRNKKLFIQSYPPGGSIPTATTLWPSALWFERELWERYGLRVEGHPDLRRLLTDYGFVGFPRQKDFPVAGYVELRYSEKNKRVTARPVSFVQEFRQFDFVSPWQS